MPHAGPDPFTLSPQPPWPAPPAGGLDAIETYLPLSAITFGGGPPRLGVLSGPLEEPQDVLFTTGGRAPGPILLGLPISVIPTLAEWSVLLLALLLLASGMALLRRRASRAGAALGMLLVSAGLGVALAIFPHAADGNLADWTGHTPAAIDALGDAPVNADIGPAFAHLEGGTVFFRIDADCAANHPPVAVDDAFTTDEDTPLTVLPPGVLANDSDPDGDPLSASLDTGPANGTLVFSSDGSFTYTPNAAFTGDVSFDYHASDNDGNDSNVATVTITVEPVEPVANDDSFATEEDTALIVTSPGVLANDSDPNGDPLSASLDTGPANGTLVFSSDGSFTYTPNPNFDGEVSFTYHANDGVNDSNVATVTITVEPVPDPP